MDARLLARITLEPGKRGGKPCIRGMRITVYDVLGWMAAGMTMEDIVSDYPELEADDIWIRDSDIVIVPKLCIQVLDDYIELVFTRGIYGVVPFNGVSISFFKDLSTLGAL